MDGMPTRPGRAAAALAGTLSLAILAQAAAPQGVPDARVVYFGGIGRMNDVPTNDLGVVADCDAVAWDSDSGQWSRPFVRLSRMSDSGELLTVEIPRRKRRTRYVPGTHRTQFDVMYRAKARGVRFRALFSTVGPDDVRLLRHAYAPSWTGATLAGNPLDAPAIYLRDGRTVIDDYSVTRATVDGADVVLEWWQTK